jgi:mannose-1-phosphate guanylyltransferase
MLKQDPKSVMAVLTADHFIQEEEDFLDLLKSSHEIAREGYLVTMGIKPTYPATGYGYIQVGNAIGEYLGIQAYMVDQFKEKPNLNDARAMIKGGKHLWNSGMFIWEVQQVLKEFERQLPEHFNGITRISDALGTDEQDAITTEVWSDLKPMTIDYGIMEGAPNTAVIPAEGLGWSDIGSWESFFDVMNVDEDGNIIRGGESISLDTRNSLFYLYGSERLVVTIGVEDLVVVDTGDVLLLCSREKAQDVRKVIKELKRNKLDDYL